MYDLEQARQQIKLLHGTDCLIEFRFPYPDTRVAPGEKRPLPHSMGKYEDGKPRRSKIIYHYNELTDELLNEFKAANEKSYNVFFSINSRKNRSISKNEEMIAADNLCNNLCIDFDPDKVIIPEGETFCLEFLQSLIAKAKVPTPTIYSRSGHGWHAFWHLAVPISVDRWLKIQGLFNLVFPFDGATDKPSGMMRLAGFVNPKYKDNLQKVVLLKDTINETNYKAEDIENCLIDIDAEILELMEKMKKGRSKKTANKKTQTDKSNKSYPFLLQLVNVHKLLDHFGIWYPKNENGEPVTDSNNQPIYCITPNRHTGKEDKRPSGLIGYADGKGKGQYNCFTCQEKSDEPRGNIVDVICYHLYKDKFPGEDYSKTKHGVPHYYRKVIAQIDKIFPGFINPEFGELESPISLIKAKLKNYEIEPAQDDNTWIANCPLCGERKLNIFEQKKKNEIFVHLNCSACCKDKTGDEKLDIYAKLITKIGIEAKDLTARRTKKKAYSSRYSEPNVDEEIKIISMKDAFNVNNIAGGKLLCFRGRISAVKDNAYAIPTVAKFYCKSYTTDACLKCGVFDKSEPAPDSLVLSPVSVRLDITDQELLDLMGQAPKKERIQQQILRSINVFGCRNTSIYVEENTNIYDVYAVPENRDDANFEGMVYVSNPTPLKIQNTYKFYGKLIKHPKTSMTMFAAYKVVREKSRVESEDITPEDIIEAANNFKSKTNDLDGLEKALKDNIQDFERGVSKVYHSFDMHIAKFLACYCPIVKFNYGGSEKWCIIDSAIIGDSGMAKTQVSNRIIDELQFGHNLDHSNATLPGLTGGRNKKDNGQFYQENGDFCIYDKEWIICEEFINNPESIKKIMFGIRKTRSDFQFIDSKMGGSHKPVWARCSKTFERNPRLYSLIENYPYGILALKELASNTADVRRFDFALIISKQDTAGWDELLEKYESYEKKYSARSRQVVLYMAKRLKTSDIVFENDYLKICRELGAKLAYNYRNEIALCSRDVISEKLARLAISFAAFTFNYSDDGSLLVKNYHIEYAHNWLEKIYSSDACGFKSFSLRTKQASVLIDDNAVKDLIRNSILPNEFIAVLLETPPIKAKYMKEIIERFDANVNQADLLSGGYLRMLTKNRALVMDKYGNYHITSAFVKALKELKDEKLPDENEINKSCGTAFG